ncbi:unnamed protein product, partial [marine sediment metagenome]
MKKKKLRDVLKNMKDEDLSNYIRKWKERSAFLADEMEGMERGS